MISGRVLDSRSSGCGFEPNQRYCIVSSSSAYYWSNTGRSDMTETFLTGTQRIEANKETDFIKCSFMKNSISLKSVKFT